MNYSLPNLRVNFTGRRFPSARVTGQARWVFEGEAPPASAAFDPVASFFVIDGGKVGRGRLWYPGDTLGCAWRSLADTDATDREAVIRFLRRFGDPLGRLPDAPSDTAAWATLQRRLHPMARSWMPGRDGLSRLPAGMREYLEKRMVHVEPDRPEWAHVLQRNAAGLYELRPPDLATFMLVEAAADVQRESPMRRCLHCGFWMRVPRSSARFCDRSCRAMHAQHHRRHPEE